MPPAQDDQGLPFILGRQLFMRLREISYPSIRTSHVRISGESGQECQRIGSQSQIVYSGVYVT